MKQFIKWITALRLYFVSGSAWEKELEGKNIHSVFTWCKDCGMKGCNIHREKWAKIPQQVHDEYWKEREALMTEMYKELPPSKGILEWVDEK